MSLMARVMVLVAIALTPAILIQAYNELAFRAERQRQIETTALRQAQLVNADLASIVEGARQLAVTLASSDRVRRLDPLCADELRLVHDALASYKDLTIFDASRSAVCSTIPAKLERIAPGPATDEAMRTGRLSIGKYQVGEISGKAYLPFSYPLHSEDGAPRGAVTVSLSLDWLGRHLADLHPPANSTISVTDRDGVVLARFPDHEKWVGTKFRSWGSDTINSATAGTGTSRGFDGKERIVGYVPTTILPQGLFVGVGLYAPDLMADIDAAFWRGSFLIVAGAAFAMGAAVIMGRRFIRQPTAALITAAASWQRGDFETRAPVGNQKSEFGALSAAFNAMADGLEQRDHRLAQITAKLEDQVAARTRELNESEARYRSYFEASPDCLFDIAVEADGTFRCAAFNPAAERTLGLDPTIYRGASPQAIFPPAIGKTLVEKFERCVASGTLERFTGSMPSPAEDRIYDVVVAPSKDTIGTVTRLLGAARDVTERNKLEDQLRQAQKLEAVGQLTGGIAHDFNNLLTACLGNLELLRGKLSETPHVRLLDGALRAAERGAKLTEQLLTFSRRQRHSPRPIDANALLLGMKEMLARAMTPSIRIEMALAGELWPLHGDENQLEVAILNLALNARDAMPRGGTMRIETANLPVGDARLPKDLAGEFVLLAVGDNGIGMDEEVLGRLFEPFFTTKGPGKGTGLGLSMVYGMAKQAGGSVLVSSAADQGTTVALILPRSQGSVMPREPQASLAPAPVGQRMIAG